MNNTQAKHKKEEKAELVYYLRRLNWQQMQILHVYSRIFA